MMLGNFKSNYVNYVITLHYTNVITMCLHNYVKHSSDNKVHTSRKYNSAV